jgi:hypothetical protein
MNSENLNSDNNDEKLHENDKKEDDNNDLKSEAVRDDIIKRDDEPMESKEPVVEETKNKVKKVFSKIFNRK